MGRRPVQGQVGLVANLERALEGLHRLIEQGCGLVSTSSPRLLCERTSEAVLRRGPIPRRIGLGVDLKRTAKGLHRLLRRSHRLFALALHVCELTLVDQQIANCNLHRRPVVGRIGLGEDRELLLKGLRRLIEESRRFFPAGVMERGDCQGHARAITLVFQRIAQTILRCGSPPAVADIV